VDPSPAARLRPLIHAATVELAELAPALGLGGLLLSSVSLSLSRALTRAARLSDPASSSAVLSSSTRSARQALSRCFEGIDPGALSRSQPLDRLRELLEVLAAVEELCDAQVPPVASRSVP
jgi:hypothetical protein